MSEEASNLLNIQTIDGFQMPSMFSVENFRSAVNYKPKPDDLFLVTYPKCGTTWAGNILVLILRKGKPLENPSEVHSTAPFLEMAGADAAEKMVRPGPIKTHLPYHLTPRSKDAKYICVTRNPKDCCVSFYHHMKNMSEKEGFNGTFDQFFELYLSGKIIYGDYFDHLLEWYSHRNEPNVLFITYEQLQEDFDATILKMASFIDDEKYAEPIRKDPELMNSIKKHSSFKEMKEFMNKGIGELFSMTAEELAKSDLPEGMKKMLIERKNKEKSTEVAKPDKPNAVQFVRKGIVGDWRNYFSEDQSRRMDEKFRERTKGTDIPSLFEKYM